MNDDDIQSDPPVAIKTWQQHLESALILVMHNAEAGDYAQCVVHLKNECLMKL